MHDAVTNGEVRAVTLADGSRGSVAAAVEQLWRRLDRLEAEVDRLGDVQSGALRALGDSPPRTGQAGHGRRVRDRRGAARPLRPVAAREFRAAEVKLLEGRHLEPSEVWFELVVPVADRVRPHLRRLDYGEVIDRFGDYHDATEVPGEWRHQGRAPAMRSSGSPRSELGGFLVWVACRPRRTGDSGDPRFAQRSVH